MKNTLLTVQYNRKISKDVYHMSLEGDCAGIEKPGQFIDILIDGFFLRRPISIFDHDASHVEILYRVVGSGTDALSLKEPGDELDVLLPLGNGFDISKRGARTLLIGGGIGMPPVHELAKQFAALSERSKPERGSSSDPLSMDNPAPEDSPSPDDSFRVLIGFRSAEDIFGIDAFRDAGIDPVIATEDGSFGIRGLVTDVMDMMKEKALTEEACAGPFNFDCVMCCGPGPMLRAVYEKASEEGVTSGQFSFEERMGCGFGACMGCTCRTKNGYKRICKDGPVLDMDEIVWPADV